MSWSYDIINIIIFMVFLFAPPVVLFLESRAGKNNNVALKSDIDIREMDLQRKFI